MREDPCAITTIASVPRLSDESTEFPLAACQRESERYRRTSDLRSEDSSAIWRSLHPCASRR
jgi:hypothetical protein